MKKYLFLTATLLVSGFLHAQTSDDDIVIKGSRPTTMELTPRQVIDSLKKRFPNAKAVKYYQTPASAVKDGWSVTDDDNLEPGSTIDRYTLSFKRSDFKYYALFKADGTLIQSKYEQYGANLPSAVKTSLKQLAGTDYKDYTIVSRTFYRRRNEDKKTEYYEVKAVKKSDSKVTKTVILDPTGKVIKVR